MLALPAGAAAPVKDTAGENLAARLERLERVLESQGLVDMLNQLESLERLVTRLRGEVEVQTHVLEQLQEQQRSLYADIDRRLQRLETGGEPEVATDPDPVAVADGGPPLETLSPANTEADITSGTSAESALMVETVPADAAPPVAAVTATVDTATAAAVPASAVDPVQIRAEYDQAFKLLKQALYDQAIRAFTDFLGRYPQGEFSDNAQYWLGEAYYVTRNFEQALAEYDRLISNYPNSQKLTHALLKGGFALQELGRNDDARERLAGLVQQYPGTTAARLAEDRLKTLPPAAAAPG